MHSCSCELIVAVYVWTGTVPVVRRTGGLNDSVFDVEHDEERADEAGREPNGFNFEGTDTNALDYALNRYAWLVGRCMNTNLSSNV